MILQISFLLKEGRVLALLKLPNLTDGAKVFVTHTVELPGSICSKLLYTLIFHFELFA
jgi:hypothetical protein